MQCVLFFLAHQIRKSDVLNWPRNFLYHLCYLTKDPRLVTEHMSRVMRKPTFWLTHIDISSHTNIYRIFMQNFQQSNYISKLPDRLCKIMFKFRTRNHRLPVETGRWQGIPFDRRTCQECESDLGDEFHYLFICPQFKEERKKYLRQYFYKKPNTYKFNELMNTPDHKQQKSLCYLISAIAKKFK